MPEKTYVLSLAYYSQFNVHNLVPFDSVSGKTLLNEVRNKIDLNDVAK
jgi:hypothetical protein